MDTEEFALRIRRHAVQMTHRGKSSHIGSILSMADIIAVLYGQVLNVRADEPNCPGRDRFVLSKGHAGAGVYAALAEKGFFPLEWLELHCAPGSHMSGHISHVGLPGVEFSTGSLGHGLPVAAGMAYAAKLDKKQHRVYVLLSDGECDEGSNWEAILFAAHHRLSNLIAIVDYNKLQSLDTVANTMGLEPFAAKLNAFGWDVHQVDGHDHGALAACLQVRPREKEKPTWIIADTVKGKGISFMENTVLWHYRTPQGEEYEAAMKELEKGTRNER